jgi:hypothetical protein
MRVSAYQGEFTRDNRFVIGTDEDFDPYRFIIRTSEGDSFLGKDRDADRSGRRRRAGTYPDLRRSRRKRPRQRSVDLQGSLDPYVDVTEGRATGPPRALD